MSIMVTLLPVFYKQRAAQFFPAWVFALPTALLRIPYGLLCATLWSIMVYFSTGMSMSAGRFWVYWLVMMQLDGCSMMVVPDGCSSLHRMWQGNRGYSTVLTPWIQLAVL